MAKDPKNQWAKVPSAKVSKRLEKEEGKTSKQHGQTQATQVKGEESSSKEPRRVDAVGGAEPKSIPADYYGPAASSSHRYPHQRSPSERRELARLAQLSRDTKPLGTADRDTISKKCEPVTADSSRSMWAALPQMQTDDMEQAQAAQATNALPEVTAATKRGSEEQPTKAVVRTFFDAILSILGLQWEGVKEEARQELVDLHSHHQQEVKHLKQTIAQQGQQQAVQTEKYAAEREHNQKQIQSLQASIRSLQASKLQSLDGTQHMPLATSDICDQLDSIIDQVKHWAKTYSGPQFDNFFQSLGSSDVHQVGGFIPLVEKLPHAMQNSKTMQKPGKGLALLLGAAAVHEIINEVVGNPFFALAGGNIFSNDSGEVLGELLDFIKQGGQCEAEALRCQVLRLFDPPANVSNSGVTGLKKSAKECRAVASATLSRTFVDKFTLGFEEGQADEAISELEEIIAETAKLAAHIWTCKARLQVSLPGPCYSSMSGALAAHPLHRGELEDDPKALDGKEIMVLFSPAVWMYGTDDGQNFDQKRLVKKGIAWMG